MNAQRAAELLDLELTAAGVPRAYRCEALEGLESWLRIIKDRGNLLQRIGLAIALEAVKALRGRHCPEQDPII